MTSDTTLNMRAAAAAAGVSRRTLERLLQRGEGPATLRIGRRRLIRRVTFEGWLAARETGLPEASGAQSKCSHPLPPSGREKT